jgi:uncharacterized protein YecE (DUF72 family)
MQPADFEIGTSGWKFDDWAGTFYPLRVPQTKWLEYYAARFSIGELNSTYYRIAPVSVYDSISKRTPPQFRLFAKVHADVTHNRKDPDTSLRTLLAALDPLHADGKLLGLLAQFPGNFHFSLENTDYLKELRDLCRGIRLCVEFRHRTWASDEAISRIRENELTWVCPDEPPLPDLMPRRFFSTSDVLYVRLHGRNSAAWHNREAGDRYNYDYSAQELTTIGNELLNVAPSSGHGYILFNNCHMGLAPANAWWLKNFFAGSLSTAGNSEPSDGFTLSAS